MMALLLSIALSQSPDPRQTLIEAGKEERSILSQIEELDISLTALRAEKSALQNQTTEFENQKLEQSERVAKATIDLQDKKNDLNKTLRALYKLHKRGIARVVFGAESPIELRRRSSYLLSLIQLSTKKLDAYKEALKNQEHVFLQR